MTRSMSLLSILVVTVAAGCGGAPSHAAAPTPSATPGFVAGPSGQLRVDDSGPADSKEVPVLFVHGLASNHHVWQAALDHVRAHRRAVALDLHGHGESSPSSKNDYSIDSYVADLEAVVDHADPPLPRFVLVGHSMGGTVVTAYAAAHPDRVAGIFYVDPTPDVTQIPKDVLDKMKAGLAQSSVKQFAGTMFSGMLAAAQPATSEQVKTSLEATPDAVLSGSWQAMFAYDPKPAMAKFSGPRFSIVTRGNDEGISLHRLPPGFAHQVMEGVSHWLMLDKPTEFAASLDTFLGGVDAPAAAPAAATAPAAPADAPAAQAAPAPTTSK